MRLIGISFAAITVLLSLINTATAENLVEALAATYNSNPDLLAARAEQRAIDENMPTAISNWRPTATITASKNLSNDDTTFFSNNNIPLRDDEGNVVIDPETGDPVLAVREGDQINESHLSGTRDNYAAQITQPIFNGFRNFNQFKGAKAEIEAGRANLVVVEQLVLLDAVTVYMDVLRDMAIVDLNENNVNLLEEQLEATNNRFEVGEVTRTDVAQSEAALAGAESQLVQAEAALRTSRATYRQVVGNAPGTLEQPPPLPPLPESEEAAVELAIQFHPTARQARFNEEAAKFDIAEAKGSLLPSLSASASISRIEAPVNFGDFTADLTGTQRRAGLNLTVPLYQSGSEYSDIRRARQVRSQRMMQIAAAEREVERNARVAWENYRAAQIRIVSTTAQVRANEIAFEGIRQEAEVGARTTLDVLQTQQTLLDSQVDLATAEHDEYIAGFALLEAIGGLTAVDLSLPVEVYDPTEYYRDVKWKPFGWGYGDD